MTQHALVKTSLDAPSSQPLQLVAPQPDVATIAQAYAECVRLSELLMRWRGPGATAVHSAVRTLTRVVELFAQDQRRKAAEALRPLRLPEVGA